MSKCLPALVALCLVVVSGCSGKDSPTAPSATATSTFSLSGQITGSGGTGLSGATVLIADGPNKGQSATTTSTGAYSFSSLPASAFTLNASASGYTPQNKSIALNTNLSISFALVKINPIFVMGGSGNQVFDMPTYVSRVHITGTYTGYASNFIVRIGGHLVVNDLLGTGFGPTVSDGTYLTTGGVVEITNSQGVAWAFTEIR